MAGQVCGQLKEIRPVAEIFASMQEEASKVISSLKEMSVS
jgi:enoyl-[acyl-carrier protein] reductase II